jgi:hypothetical protein
MYSLNLVRDYNRQERLDKVKEIQKFIDVCERTGFHDLAERERAALVQMDKPQPTAQKQCYAWIGINPEPDTISMKELFLKAVEKLPYSSYEMCVEQNTKGGIRPHLHILAKINGNVRKNHVITRMGKIFNLKNNFIQVRVSSNEVYVKQCSDYVNGKKAADKMGHVDQDIKDREKYNIPHVYRWIPEEEHSPSTSKPKPE